MVFRKELSEVVPRFRESRVELEKGQVGGRWGGRSSMNNHWRDGGSREDQGDRD